MKLENSVLCLPLTFVTQFITVADAGEEELPAMAPFTTVEFKPKDRSQFSTNLSRNYSKVPFIQLYDIELSQQDIDA